jgi:ADP-heptose:LPS heptosyltransferase
MDSVPKKVMKKIAFAMEKFSRYKGGAESYAVSLATFLIENGWEVHLFGESWDGEPEAEYLSKSWGRPLAFDEKKSLLRKE